jgi:hypothetical protein
MAASRWSWRNDRPLRFVLIYQCLIAYAPEEKPVLVLAVLHGKRGTCLLAGLNERHERTRELDDKEACKNNLTNFLLW